jgi:CHAT domain-containing protein
MNQSKDVTTYSTARRTMRALVEWLWDAAAGPVLQELGLIDSPDSGWARVWWVCTGLLSILPIHAAGYHETVPYRSVLDCVIPSYTPSIKALSFSRKSHSRMQNFGQQRAILVGMPKTPKLKDIPFAEQEIRELRDVLAQHVKVEVVHEPTYTKVISSVADSQIIHLACHGDSMPDPSESRLYLQDWENNPLTIAKLMYINPPSAQFAYLSACDTALMKNYRLLDESIHLCSAMQLVGYPSVVGSLWYVEDNLNSILVSTQVYRSMITAVGKIQTGRSAEGLHSAIRSLREKTRNLSGMSKKYPSDVLIWGSYVHFGV